MSKATIIRRKALDSVRRQDWDSAIKEYVRLSELDRSNPNIYNELGDLYLKTGNKAEAGNAFMQAIDAYSQVSLFNNAVAVCKKVMRLLPSRVEVQAKLGLIRMKQGLVKEAESYYISYLDRLAEGTSLEPVEISKTANEIAQEMADSETVLSKLAECLLTLRLEEDAVGVLVALFGLYERNDNDAGMEAVAARIEGLGASHLLTGRAPEAPAAEEHVITEDKLWTDEHTEGERIRPAEGAPEWSAYGEVDIPPSARTPSGNVPPAEPPHEAEATPPDADTDDAVGEDAPAFDPIPESAAETPSPGDPGPPPDEPQHTPPAPEAPGDPTADKPAHLNVSAIIDELGGDGGAGGDADYRSHYDLGMAYLEMGLYPEAIREYQAAARSVDYRVKSLEMIGVCFLHQNQPTLAIKQLSKALGLIGKDDSEALGIRYNLGLAYEMVGDIDQARSQFEEVYVVDVTFRDVGEKLQKYTKR